MARHIVFTGPDGAGKSTQVERMARILTTTPRTVLTNRAIRYSTEMEPALPTIMKHLLNSIESDDRENVLVLHDRWNYPEEMIYPKVMANRITPLASLSSVIEQRINELDKKITFVVLNAPPSVLTKRLSGRGGENYIELRHLQGLYDAYKEFAETTSIKRVIYVEDEEKQIKEMLTRNIMDELVTKGVFH